MSPDLTAIRQAAASLVAEQVEEIVRLAEIPAPPFGEERRARYLLARLAEIGLDRPVLDEEGNALALLEGRVPGRRILVAAHMDTVFPEGTDVTVVRENGVLRGPGIGDNAANLGAMLSVARILRASGGVERGEVLFAGTVGEEGLGNLRGMHRLMRNHGASIDAVICVDGNLGKVVIRGVGSRRYRIRCRGPGGHSFGDFGRPSAIHGLSRLITRITEIPVPGRPKTTFNVGSFEGGDGITTIAAEARLLLDLRSEDPDELTRLDDAVLALVDEEAGRDGLEFDHDLIGSRPAGGTDPEDDLVAAVLGAHAALGVETEVGASSTDANVPMSLGIPAVTFGTYVGQGAHTLEEEARIAGMETGLAVAALLLTRLTA